MCNVCLYFVLVNNRFGLGKVFEEKQKNRSPTLSPAGGNSPDLGPDPVEPGPGLPDSLYNDAARLFPRRPSSAAEEEVT